MHDPKFEKDVQQRMEELSFSPPEAVWLNVEKAVRSEKKRRRILPFWLFFAPAVLLMGTGVIYFMKKTPATPAVATTVAGTETARAHTETARTETAHTETARTEAAVPGTGAAQPEAIGSGTKTAGSGNARPSTEAAGSESKPAGSESKPAGFRNTSAKAITPATGEPAAIATTISGNAGIRRAGGKRRNSAQVDKQKDEVSFVTNSNTVKNNELKVSSISGFRPLERDRSPVTAKALPSFAKTPAKVKVELPKPRHPWESGFTAHLGLSSINQGLLDKLSVTSMDYRNSYSPVQSNPKTYTTSVQPDVSFAAGVFLQKGLSKDWAVSLGLNLHYYSSRLKTGGLVTAPYASLAPSLISSGSFVQSAAAVNYPYYAPGDRITYTNRYYFMELPASAIWQVGHRKKLPLFLEGGVTFSYLVSSNSLYYEPKVGVFYKDASMINKTQVGVFSGLMFGLPVKGLSIQAGPQLQYGLTNLINSGGSGNQHLMYGGIKVVFLPGRSKPR